MTKFGFPSGKATQKIVCCLAALLAAHALAFHALQAQATPPDASTPAAKTPVPPDKVPQYDVISIKPNKTGSGRISVHIDDGNYNAFNIALKGLISNAYDVREDLITGLSGWASSAHYDIKAKVLDPDQKVFDSLSPQQWRSMLMPILQRFHLKCHLEVKTLPIYELVVAKGGPKFATPVPGADFRGMKGGGMSVHNQHLTGHDVPLSDLAVELSDVTQRTVLDKTGLNDKYDLELVWTREDVAAAMSADSNRTKVDAGDTPPVIETALQEQLGLKLISAKGPVNTLVIDSVEPPAED